MGRQPWASPTCEVHFGQVKYGKSIRGKVQYGRSIMGKSNMGSPLWASSIWEVQNGKTIRPIGKSNMGSHYGNVKIYYGKSNMGKSKMGKNNMGSSLLTSPWEVQLSWACQFLLHLLKYPIFLDCLLPREICSMDVSPNCVWLY